MIKNAIWLFTISIIILFVFWPSYVGLQEKKNRNITYQSQINQLKEENTRLIEENRMLKEDPVYLEAVAREKMGIAKEGEVVYRLTPEVPTKEGTAKKAELEN